LAELVKLAQKKFELFYTRDEIMRLNLAADEYYITIVGIVCVCEIYNVAGQIRFRNSGTLTNEKDTYSTGNVGHGRQKNCEYSAGNGERPQ